MKKSYFLALTSIEEFWDRSQNMIYLGKWCLPYDNHLDEDHLSDKIFESHIKGFDDAHNIYQNTDNIYEKILPIVSRQLNTLHKKNYNVRYWRILIGPWLQLYITAVYDRYERINGILTRYPDINTILLSDECFIVPNNTEEFNLRFSDDVYNLQIYSKIFNFIGNNFPKKIMLQEDSKYLSKKIPRSCKKMIFRSLLNFHRFFIKNINKSPIVISNTYFPKFFEIKLISIYFGKYFSTSNLDIKYNDFQKNDFIRQSLSKINFGDDEFSKCLSSMLFSDMPKCFLEGYDTLIEIGKEKYPKSAKAIFSANSWWYDEVFKLWSADCAENGSLLMGTPHGGDSSLINEASFKHEENIVDNYYNWYCNEEKNKQSYTTLPATKLMGLNPKDIQETSNEILWVTTTTPRYISFGFPILYPEYFEEYLIWHIKFTKKLSDTVMSNFTIRAHSVDHGWNIVSRIKNQKPNINIQSLDIQFRDALNNSKLYVCDHQSTTYLEALSINKPTILFWSRDAYRTEKEYEKYFNLLRKVGILYDNPESAAEAINLIYADVDSWWKKPERQKVVKQFVEKFCPRHFNEEEMWINEFNKISESYKKYQDC